MKERIEQIMAYYKLTQAQFAEAIQITPGGVSHLSSERNKPSMMTTNKIIKAFPNINITWLLEGKGEMLKNNQVTNAQPTSLKSIADESLSNQFELFSIVENSEKTSIPEKSEKDESINSKLVSESNNNTFTKMENTITDTHLESTVSVESSPLNINRSESKKSEDIQTKSQILNSQSDKKVKKIVFFYEDKTFTEFFPNPE